MESVDLKSLNYLCRSAIEEECLQVERKSDELPVMATTTLHLAARTETHQLLHLVGPSVLFAAVWTFAKTWLKKCKTSGFQRIMQIPLNLFG